MGFLGFIVWDYQYNSTTDHAGNLTKNNPSGQKLDLKWSKCRLHPRNLTSLAD